MSGFLTQDQALEEISGLVGKAQNAKLAVAFWGEGAVDSLQLKAAKGNVQVICNLLTGATNPDEIVSLMGLANVKIKHNSRLHAKTYWTSTGAIVGSSNASANGLNFEGIELRGWLEANIRIRDSALLQAIESWFDAVWNDSDDIEDDDLERARILWDKRRNSRGWQVPEGASLIEALRANPDDFKDRVIIFSLHSEDLSDLAKRRLEVERKEATVSNRETLDCYERGEYPAGAYVIDFHVGPRWGTRFGGLWRILEMNHRIILDEETENFITLCQPVDEIYNRTLSKNDEKLVKSGIRALWQLQEEKGVLHIYEAKDVLFAEP